MSILELKPLLRPEAVCVVGASGRPDSLGTSVMRSLLDGRFAGPVLPVNPKHKAVSGVLCYPAVDALPLVPDLAVVCVPPPAVADALGRLGALGTRVAVIMTADPDGDGATTPFKAEIAASAQTHGMRILGPGSTGVQVPALGLNASWIVTAAKPGKVALLSQSGSAAAALVEWAGGRGVGFSHVISLGDAMDIDLAELLDYFAYIDTTSRSVLLYVRAVRDARRFMSAVRAIAHTKHVITMRSGERIGDSRLGAETRSRVFAGTDQVYEAAVRRAGMLRAHDTDELFDALETISKAPALYGGRLVIVSNGRAPADAAADALISGGGALAVPGLATWSEVARRLPPSGRGPATPLDLGRDADAARFAAVIRALLREDGISAVLVMHTPTAVAPGLEVARAVADEARASAKTLLACWLGRTDREAVKRLFVDERIPLYDTPDKAVRAFLHLLHYRRNQDLLLEAPAMSARTDAPRRRTEARRRIADWLDAGCLRLNEQETMALLDIYGMSVVPTRVAAEVEDVVAAAEDLGYPVAVRLCSPSLVRGAHLSDLALDLYGADTVRAAAFRMIGHMGYATDAEVPRARFMVQKMHGGSGPMFSAGLSTDPEFGPVLVFGVGGVAASRAGAGRAVGLPPLNSALAGDLLEQVAVERFLDPGCAVFAALRAFLVRLSRLAIDIPEIAELEISPLVADVARDGGVTVLEARATLDPRGACGHRLAIRPYPRDLEEHVETRLGPVLVRPIRPEDEPAYRDFLGRLSEDDMLLRFFGRIEKMPRAQFARFVHIDYDREMEFIAIDEAAGGEILGSVRTIANPDNTEAEYGILVRSDTKGRGLGRVLMEKMIRYCRQRGTGRITGLVLRRNQAMLTLCERLGFGRRPSDVDEAAMDVWLPL